MKTNQTYSPLAFLLLTVKVVLASAPNINYIPVHCTSISPVSISADITDSIAVDTSVGYKPRLYFKKKSDTNVLATSNDNLSNGWKYVEATNNSAPFQFDFDFVKLTSATTKNDTIQYFIIAQNTSGDVNWMNAVFTNNPTSVALTSSAFPINNTFFFRTIKTYKGTLTIDSTGIANDTNFLSITKAGGLFNVLNEGALAGNVTVVINNSLYAENGAYSLNEWSEYNGCNIKSSASYNLKLKPALIGTQIRGKSGDAIIKLNGADRVTIEGRTVSTSDVNGLSIMNDSSATNTAVVQFISNGTNGCKMDTIRFCNLVGGAPQNVSAHHTFGVYANGVAIDEFSSGKGIGHHYNSFERNQILRVRYGIALIGSDTSLNKANSILYNVVGPESAGIDAIGKIGIVVSNQDSASIVGNVVRNVGGDLLNIHDTADRVGIYVGTIQNNLWDNTFHGDSSTTHFINSTIEGNTVSDIVNESGFSAVGIAYLNAYEGASTNNLIANNMLHSIRANGYVLPGNHAAAIGIIGGNGDFVAHNSINLKEDLDPAGTADAVFPAAGIRVNSTAKSIPTVQNMSLLNNSIVVDVTTNNGVISHSISVATNYFLWAEDGLDFNNYYPDNTNLNAAVGGIGSGATFSNKPSLISWNTTYSPNQDNNSVSVDPLYKSATDLHLSYGSSIMEIGKVLEQVKYDFDGDFRLNKKYPSLGADEFGKYYVWNGRENSYGNALPNWRNYEAPPTYGNDSIKVLVDTKGFSWVLTDSFAVAALEITEANYIGLNSHNFHVNDYLLMADNAKIYSGESDCAHSFGSDETNGAVYLSGVGIKNVSMESGSLCNLVVTADTVLLNSDINVANDFISKAASSVLITQGYNISVQGDLRFYGQYIYENAQSLDSSLISINGSEEQMVEIRNQGTQPGLICNLSIDKGGSGNNSVARLVVNINIANVLQLKRGKLISDGSDVATGLRFKTITMLNTDSNAVQRMNGNINDAFYQGKLRRKLGSTSTKLLFPMGVLDLPGKHGVNNAAYYTPVVIETLDTTGNGLFLTAAFYDRDPDSANVGFTGEPAGDYSSAIEDGPGNWVDVKGDYVWHVDYEGSNLLYNIQFSAPFMVANNQDELASTPNELRVLKRDLWNSGNWGFQGVHAIAANHTLMPDFSQNFSARRSNLNTFSGFSAGGNSAAGMPLPVQLIEFSASVIDNNFIKLNWSTSAEINNAGFELQRSTDGKDFKTIYWVAGAGNSTAKVSYSYDDYSVEKGVRYYYRLIQRDFDGDKEVSQIISATLSKLGGIKGMDLAPNPAVHVSSVLINSTINAIATISITNLNGATIHSKEVKISSGMNKVDLDVTNLLSGMYLVSLRTNSETFTKQLIVQ